MRYVPPYENRMKRAEEQESRNNYQFVPCACCHKKLLFLGGGDNLANIAGGEKFETCFGGYLLT